MSTEEQEQEDQSGAAEETLPPATPPAAENSRQPPPPPAAASGGETPSTSDNRNGGDGEQISRGDAPADPPPAEGMARKDSHDDVEGDDPPEGFPTTTVTVPSGDSGLARHRRTTSASSDDASVLTSNDDDVFEDEPDKCFPAPSPKRIAARMERRKLARKQKIVPSEKRHALSKVGLPGLRPFARGSSKREKADDESSHWSSSDGENSEADGRDPPHLSKDDIEICQRLDEEYERALEEREVVYTARYNSVRQSACFSVFFMLLYLALGTMFFRRQANWTVSESVLFSVYTITTVGYGHLETPQTPAFQLYTIFFIFIGIAGITLMVAQTYQCIALEASRAEHAREHTQLARYRTQRITRTPSPRMASASSDQNGQAPEQNSASPRLAHQMMADMNIPTDWIDRIFGCIDKTKIFLGTTEVGRSISVVLPFMGLILIGALVVGPIEGWTLVESLYFAVVSLTTVGFGDYSPTKNASIFFCILWLPCSIGFMSLFLTNVAAFYIRLSDKNIERIEAQLRRRVRIAKDVARKERDAAKRRALRGQGLESTVPAGAPGDQEDDENTPGVALTKTHDARSVGSDSLEETKEDDDADVHLFGSPEQLGQEVATRREKILMNFRGQWQRDDGAESDGSGDSLIRKGKGLTTMKDMLKAVHANMPKESTRIFRAHGPEQEILSIRSNRFLDSHSLRKGSLRKPSFALRALVQERFAEIIAAEVAGFESSIEIKENTLSVTIGTLRQTTSKWMVPRRARRALRAVAFEALYFVGEHGLITRGADALFDLSPMEFHRLFTPLLAALGDADSMEAWLASTDILAEVDLNRGAPASSPKESQDSDKQSAPS